MVAEKKSNKPTPTSKGTSKKTLRGLITGQSRRSKKQLLKAEGKAVSEPKVAVTKDSQMKVKSVDRVVSKPESTVDEDTVYGAEFDNASKMSTSVTETSDTVTKESVTESMSDPIQIVLLIMDPETRRFELLQLEFDSAKASISDILRQIPVSATEESLRKQAFDCICSIDGEEYDKSKPLSTYIRNTSVAIAVPKSAIAKPKNASKMAKPILYDPKVAAMLKSAGIVLPQIEKKPVKKPVVEVPAVDTKKEEVKPVEAVKEITRSTPVPTHEPKAKSPTYVIEALIMVVVFSLIRSALFSFHTKSTTPLRKGDSLNPGEWRSRCGIFKDAQKPCVPAYIQLGTDGVLKVFEGEDVVFSLIGKACNEVDSSCTPGAVIEESGYIKIGGAIPKVGVKSKAPLSPWPFEEEIKSRKGMPSWFPKV